MIASSGFGDGLVWRWSLEWSRMLRPGMSLISICYSNCLRGLLFPLVTRIFFLDSIQGGNYSVKYFTMEIAKADPTFPRESVKGIWRGLVSYRIEIFSWLVLRGKLNTKDKLARLEIIPSDEIHYALCGVVPETCDHLFLHCSVSWKIWCWWLNLWNLNWVPPSSIR